MKVSAAALPTVRWKWAATQAVLCTTEFRVYAAFTAPPNPPTMNSSPASSTEDRVGFPQGRVRSQPNSPVPPRSRPATSSEAITVKAVTRLGNEMAMVLKVWNSFQAAGIPGSWNWWWNPTGVESTRKRVKTIRASGSEKSLPPASRGATAYQIV